MPILPERLRRHAEPALERAVKRCRLGETEQVGDLADRQRGDLFGWLCIAGLAIAIVAAR